VGALAAFGLDPFECDEHAATVSSVKTPAPAAARASALAGDFAYTGTPRFPGLITDLSGLEGGANRLSRGRVARDDLGPAELERGGAVHEDDSEHGSADELHLTPSLGEVIPGRVLDLCHDHDDVRDRGNSLRVRRSGSRPPFDDDDIGYLPEAFDHRLESLGCEQLVPTSTSARHDVQVRECGWPLQNIGKLTIPLDDITDAAGVVQPESLHGGRTWSRGHQDHSLACPEQAGGQVESDGSA
jgi:hypothetical protein